MRFAGTEEGQSMLRSRIIGAFVPGAFLLTLGVVLIPGAAAASDTPALSPHAAARAGAVSGPFIHVSPSSIDFGSAPVGQSVIRLLSIANAGDQTLTVSGVQSSDPHFTFSFTGPVMIQPGEQHHLTVTYQPTGVMVDQGALTLTSDAVNGPATVPVIGSGISEPDFGRVLLRPAGLLPGDQLGNSASGAGDLNGDGYDDVIIGSWTADIAGGDEGRAYVYHGAATPSSTPTFVLNGQASGDNFGTSVAGGDDVNGDGFDDIVVGAWKNDAAGQDAGRAYVFFGGPSMDAVPDVVLTGEPFFSGRFGVSVSMAGDVNGDGHGDVLVGAPGPGMAYLYLGGPAMDSVADRTFAGGPEYGWSVSGAGDVNGDGFADVIVGEYANGAGGFQAGRTYVYFGGSSPDDVADWVLTGVAGERFGVDVSSAGDVNGDGFADVIVGADYNSSAGTRAGRAYIFHGGTTPDTSPDLTLTGDLAQGSFGGAVSSAGDVNHDGYDDLFVGAWLHSAPAILAGRAYVFEGGPTADDVPDFVFDGEVEGDRLGISVAAAGDVDGDGGPDLVMGAYFNDFSAPDAGRAYVVSISTPPPPTNLPPVMTAPASIFAAEGVLVSFSIQATDPEGDPVTLGALNRPVGAVFIDQGNGSAQFTWTPSFSQAGTHVVTFTARDALGAGAQKQVTIVVDNVNRGPAASAGGPYTGVVNIPVAFNATGSSDPDGDALTYEWNFGDGTSGVGAAPAHAYASGGIYLVSLAVGDGSLESTASTTATIQDVFEARAFLDGGNRTTRLNSGKAFTCVQVEPVDRSYANSSVVTASIIMISPGTGSVDRISAEVDKTILGVDRDRNGIDEITACFRKEDLRLLFGDLTGGRHVVGVAVEGDLASGGRFHATLEMEVVASGGGVTASVSPNPLNPEGTLTFRTMRPGPVTVTVFDPAGRSVRTLRNESFLPAGYHDVKLDGTGMDGATLASGVYFYRIETIEGVGSGRFVVMK